MMDGLEERARSAGEARVAQVVARLAEQVPGAVAEDGRVVISGRGLWRDASLRWIAGWLR